MANDEPASKRDEIDDFLSGHPSWSHKDGWLERTYETDGWRTTLMVVNEIGFFAEAADHHPELLVNWGSVTVRLQTHTADGVTLKDLQMGKELEARILWRPATSEEGLDGRKDKWIKFSE